MRMNSRFVTRSCSFNIKFLIIPNAREVNNSPSRSKIQEFRWNKSIKSNGRPMLQVTDTNDNAPTFQSTAYSFDVPENMPRGSRIGQVVATDADADGPNSQLSYTLISDWANDVFSLNPSTGVFTLTASLDYEQ
ncbi:unnamed protein product, partial [Heterotrigona itama]